MASQYPGALDVMLAPGSTLAGPPTHLDVEELQNDAIEAIQAELGVDPAGAAASVAARILALEGAAPSDPADGSITYNKLDPAIWDQIHRGWESFTPQTNNMVLGTGGNTSGVYRRIGETCDFQIEVAFGSSASLSSGRCEVRLPFTPERHWTGPMTWVNANTGTYRTGTWLTKHSVSGLRWAELLLPRTTDGGMNQDGVDASAGRAGLHTSGAGTHAFPSHPSSSDYIFLCGTYRISSGERAGTGVLD